MAVVYLATSAAMWRGFDAVERTVAIEDMDRLRRALRGEQARLGHVVGDWAPWDDTYRFVQDGNQAYVERNLTQNVLRNFDLDLLSFLNDQAEVVGALVWRDPARGADLLHAELLAHVAERDLLLRHDEPDDVVTGVVALPRGPALVASAPIVHSDLTGPRQGTMLAALRLDRKALDRLESATRLQLTARAPTGASEPRLEEASENELAAYLPVPDLYGDPAVVLRAALARPVHGQAQASMRLLLLVLSGVGLATAGGAYVLLRGLLASRRALAASNERLAATARERTAKLRAANAKLQHDAQHDVLTGLPNRALFMDRLEHAVLRQQRDPAAGFAVMYLDTDKFKSINDELGHGAGDAFLQQLAQRLASSIRRTDTVARFGGDEFTVLLEGAGDERVAREVAATILEAVRRPFDLDGNTVRMGMSGGLALSTPKVDEPEAILRAADVALYRAKEAGPNQLVLADFADAA